MCSRTIHRSHIIRRAEALRRGAADHQLQRQCRTGAWRRLRPGRYAPRAEFDALDARERHRLRAVETLRAAASDAVLSHQSAAVLHGLDLWNTPLAVAHLTRSRPTHPAPPRPLRDAAARRDHRGRRARRDDRGADRVHRVLDQLDGRSESVGESRSRVLMVRERLPVPNCQSNLYGADGNHLGRVDFLFEEFGVVGEFDGRGKYGRLVPDGQVPADVVWAEKKREDAIRATGRQVVRWSWDELETPHVIVRRIRDAFERARLSTQPRGYVEHTPQA